MVGTVKQLTPYEILKAYGKVDTIYSTVIGFLLGSSVYCNEP